jgi:Domain of unknown function (DUF6484)
MRRKESQIAHLDELAPQGKGLSRDARIGRIESIDDSGVVRVWVDFELRKAATARLAVPASAEDIRCAMEAGQSVLLLLEGGDPERPVIVGFVEDRAKPAAPKVIEADVDGKRVRVVAQDEVVLECGSASITLRRNGRVIIKGTYVETHSDGTNRIKGGQVRIN